MVKNFARSAAGTALGLALMASGAAEATTFELGLLGALEGRVLGDVELVVDGEYDDIGEWVSSLEAGVALGIDEIKLDSIDVNLPGQSWDESDITSIEHSVDEVPSGFQLPILEIGLSSSESGNIAIAAVDLSGVEEFRGDLGDLDGFLDFSDSLGLDLAGVYSLGEVLDDDETFGLLVSSRESATVPEPSAAVGLLLLSGLGVVAGRRRNGASKGIAKSID